jgi:hypothetical protein
MQFLNIYTSRTKKSVVIHSIHPDAVGIIDRLFTEKIDYYLPIFKSNKKTFYKICEITFLNKTDANSGDFKKCLCKLL